MGSSINVIEAFETFACPFHVWWMIHATFDGGWVRTYGVKVTC